MGTKERRDREKEATRAKILSAARDLFTRDGYDAVTMRGIAEHIEYTPTAIYHHFRNKQELVTELCHVDFQSLRAHFGRAANIADPIERIREIGLAYLDFAERFPSDYQFMFMTSKLPIEHSPEYIAENVGNPEEDAYAFLRMACQQALDEGRLRPEFQSADELAQMMWAVLHGLVSLRLVKQHDAWVPWVDLRTAAHNMIESVFRGVLKEPASVG